MTKYFVPALLSGAVCPGLGQMVKGEVLKGILIMLCLPLLLFITVFLSILFSIQLGIVLSAGTVGAYLWNIYDAYSHVPRRSKP